MRTKQIANQPTGSGDTTAKTAGRDSRHDVESASRELLAKARYDAFQLMTEARGEAETILDEARAEAAGTVTAARITAEATTTKAQAQADATKIAAKEEAATIVAGAHRTAGEHSQTEDPVALKAEHRALSERVSTLRIIADQLEDRFAALAKTAGTPPAKAADPSPQSPEPVLDYSPSVAAAATNTDTETPSEPEIKKDSFYNRRSANLPRLGDDRGRSALNITRMFRETQDE